MAKLLEFLNRHTPRHLFQSKEQLTAENVRCVKREGGSRMKLQAPTSCAVFDFQKVLRLIANESGLLEDQKA